MNLAPLAALSASRLLTPQSSLPSPTPSVGSEIKIEKRQTEERGWRRGDAGNQLQSLRFI